MTTLFPGAVDAIPRPGAATYMDDTGFEGDIIVDDLADAIEALEAELLTRNWPLTINGNMDHFQGVGGSGTQTSTTTYSTTTSYAADEIFVRPVGASVTQQRSTTVPNNRSRYSLAVIGAASVTTVDIGQRIRARRILVNGKQLQVFSCNVRNESGAAYTPSLLIGTPAATDDFTTVTNRLTQPLQSCADSAWTRVYHVFDPSAYTNIDNGMECVLRIPSGSSVAADTNRIAQFDVRPGAALTPFLPPEPDMQEYLCKRSFERFQGSGTNYAQFLGVAAGASDARFMIGWSVQKYANPTITFSDNGALAALNNGFSAADTGTLSVATAGQWIAQARMNTIGGTVTLVVGDAVHIRWVDNTKYYDVNARI